MIDGVVFSSFIAHHVQLCMRNCNGKKTRMRGKYTVRGGKFRDRIIVDEIRFSLG